MIKLILAIVVKCSGALFSFLLALFITRNYDATSAGAFFYFLSLLTLSRVLISGGYNFSLHRFVTTQTCSADYKKYGLIAASNICKLYLFFSIIFIIFIIFDWVKIDNPLIFLYTLIVYSLMLVFSTIIQSRGNSLLGLFLSGPANNLLLLIILFFLFSYLSNIYYSIAVAVTTCFIISFAFFYYKEEDDTKKKGNEDVIHNLHSSSKNMYISQVMGQLLLQSPLLCLGFLSSVDNVAYYNVFLKISSISSILLLAINKYFIPILADSYANKSFDEFKKMVFFIIKVLIFTITPFFSLFFVFASDLLGVFGDVYVKYTVELRVVLIAQFISVLTGPVGTLLLISGNEKIFKKINMKVAFIMLFLSPLMVFYFDLIGAVIAFFLATLLPNIFSWYVVKQRLKINTYIGIFTFVK